VPNIKSAIKRVEVAERNRQRNVAYKSTVKTVTKKFLTRMGEYNAKPSEEVLTEVKTLLNDTFSKIDKAVSSGVIHALKKVQTKAV
jgi:small subunit ribosomal protein S20